MRFRTALSLGRILTGFVLTLVTAVAGIATASPAALEPDDGYTASERAEYEQLMTQVEVNVSNSIPAMVIIDPTSHNVCFGMYRLSQMTEPGWELFGRTVAWAMDYTAPSEARIFLATYNGTLDPDQRDEDGLAAYNYLVDVFGIDSVNLEVGSQTALETEDFSGYDLVMYTNSYPRAVDNVVGAGVPFVTTSVLQTNLLGIGTGDFVMHVDRDYFYVADNNHPITETFDVGLVELDSSMWMNATYVDGNGIALVTAETGNYYPPVQIGVSCAWTVELGSTETMYISLDNYHTWLEMGGFDLMLQYNTEVMVEILDVLPGSILTDCGWEYFEWRLGGEANCGGEPCTDSVLHIVAVADVASVPGTPSCLADASGSLAKIVFRFTDDPAMYDVGGAVRFVWFDCGNNIISNAAGDTLSISQTVRNEYGLDITDDVDMPTFCGAPSSCITDSSIIRRVDFCGGTATVIAPMPVLIGDVNLNLLAYEIADAILFANALVFGSDVFNIDLEDQLAATDCNNDDLLFTLDDYVYLWRVIFGDAPPLKNSISGDTVQFEQDVDNKVVRMNYPDSVRAVLLVFEGDLEPRGQNDESRPFDGTHTRVLMDIYRDNPDVLSHDSLFFYTGEGTLVEAYAAYDGITSLPTGITITSSSCCRNRGNVDHSADGSVDIVDLIRLIQYIFEDGTPPPCFDEADVNVDGAVNISDLVRMVDFMFLHGEPFPSCE
ncbi:MAG TPA: dockerin type I domain-containing protein [candidate division Zixibacteria bacterium]|nr:dockerin type I domain-containing protein [candidate division Zixibacteria bacterium]